MATDWKPFPLYLFKTDVDHILLPTLRDFASLAEARNRVELDISDFEKNIQNLLPSGDGAKSESGMDDIDREKAIKEFEERVRGAKLILAEHDRQVERLTAAFESKKDQATFLDYELAWPSFDEYLKAEDDAKDWRDDVPHLNQGRLARRLLAGRVKLDGKILELSDLGKRNHIEMNALWSEMKTMTYSDYSRIPFM